LLTEATTRYRLILASNGSANSQCFDKKI